jgi:hypothetical protein
MPCHARESRDIQVREFGVVLNNCDKYRRYIPPVPEQRVKSILSVPELIPALFTSVTNIHL